MNPVYPNPLLRPFPPFMPITKFVSQILPEITLQTNLRGNPSGRGQGGTYHLTHNNTGGASRNTPVDAAEQAHRRDISELLEDPREVISDHWVGSSSLHPC